ncbi:hypothetical protein B296_00036149 [Ensete ventricosum]|uniref:Uncharacterized protein n=1 Tax=Ensete ventricosum TaxID=4639 RepID=A0A426Y9S0_ENSVE|nr:hypothetical protein B296_00036149 [Ensete ventricosum]
MERDRGKKLAGDQRWHLSLYHHIVTMADCFGQGLGNVATMLDPLLGSNTNLGLRSSDKSVADNWRSGFGEQIVDAPALFDLNAYAPRWERHSRSILNYPRKQIVWGQHSRAETASKRSHIGTHVHPRNKRCPSTDSRAAPALR